MAQKVYTIYEAKTQLSKLGKRAAAGQTLYVGAYGQAAFIIAPIPKSANRGLKLGMFEHTRVPNDGVDTLHLPDPEFDKMIQDSINAPLL